MTVNNILSTSTLKVVTGTTATSGAASVNSSSTTASATASTTSSATVTHMSSSTTASSTYVANSSATSKVTYSGGTTSSSTTASVNSSSTTAKATSSSTTASVNSSSTTAKATSSSTTATVNSSSSTAKATSSSTTATTGSTGKHVGTKTSSYTPSDSVYTQAKGSVVDLINLGFGKKDDVLKTIYKKYGFDKTMKEGLEKLASNKVLTSGTYRVGTCELILPELKLTFSNDLTLSKKASGNEVLQVEGDINKSLDSINSFVNDNDQEMGNANFYYKLGEDANAMVDSDNNFHLQINVDDSLMVDVNMTKLLLNKLDVTISKSKEINNNIILTTNVEIETSADFNIRKNDPSYQSEPVPVYEVGTLWENLNWNEMAEDGLKAAKWVVPVAAVACLGALGGEAVLAGEVSAEGILAGLEAAAGEVMAGAGLVAGEIAADAEEAAGEIVTKAEALIENVGRLLSNFSFAF